MVLSISRLQKKNATQLEKMYEDNKNLIGDAELENKNIQTVLQNRKNEKRIENGLYMVGFEQTCFATVKDGSVVNIFTKEKGNHYVYHPIHIRVKDDEFYIKYKKKECKLTLICNEPDSFCLNIFTLACFCELKDDEIRKSFKNQISEFLNQSDNETLKNIISESFKNLNYFIFKTKELTSDNLIYFADVLFVKSLLKDDKISSFKINMVCNFLHDLYMVLNNKSDVNVSSYTAKLKAFNQSFHTTR